MPTSLEPLVSDPGRYQTLKGSADGLRITKTVDQCYGPIQKTVVKWIAAIKFLDQFVSKRENSDFFHD